MVVDYVKHFIVFKQFYFLILVTVGSLEPHEADMRKFTYFDAIIELLGS